MQEKRTIPPQHQHRQPGIEKKMKPQPVYTNDKPGLGRLKDKVALITGGDSGIGRAVAIAFAKEGASVAISYLDEHEDARETAEIVEWYGSKSLLLPADITSEEACKNLVQQTLTHFGKLDILVNNAAVQFQQKDITNITADQLELTFRTNIFSQFYLAKYAVPYLKEGSSIINTASITAFRGNPDLMDYSATKAAIIGFTRSLSQSLVSQGIRVNAVAPGPVWTPLIPSSFDEEKVAEFGDDVPMGRPAEPVEIAPCYVFLASEESAFITGQTLHPNGGSVINA
ncbi:SDR family oxidoreductase [Nostoc ellipsosporum NOK]|jgi:NAD(P)-dependent dehydrogenase (short-subunit alcohol dehydrogenase family)|nr:SDR family oxidoreductase [Nostoc ellipsosporum NOK]